LTRTDEGNSFSVRLAFAWYVLVIVGGLLAAIVVALAGG
jgi:hypothetical protein